MKYKEGEKVRVNQFLTDKLCYGGLTFCLQEMGFKHVTIKNSYKNLHDVYAVEETSYLYSDAMLAGIYDDKDDNIKYDFIVTLKIRKRFFIHNKVSYQMLEKKDGVVYVANDYMGKAKHLTKEEFNNAYNDLLKDITEVGYQFKQT